MRISKRLFFIGGSRYELMGSYFVYELSSFILGFRVVFNDKLSEEFLAWQLSLHIFLGFVEFSLSIFKRK